MRVVVFGGGYWGRNYVRELAGHLAAVIEPDAARAAQLRAQYNVRVLAALPDDLAFDGAVIATPPSTHVPLALPLLQRGHYVLVEKPLAPTVAEAAQLAGFARCMVGHLYLYHPVIEEWRALVRARRVLHVYCRRTNAGPIRPWQDALWDLAPHDVSVLNWWFGTPSTASATGTRDWAALHLQYPSTDALVYVAWVGGPKVRRTELVLEGEEERRVFDDVATVLPQPPLRRMLDAFLSGSWDRCTAAEGLEVVRVLQAVSW